MTNLKSLGCLSRPVRSRLIPTLICLPVTPAAWSAAFSFGRTLPTGRRLRALYVSVIAPTSIIEPIAAAVMPPKLPPDSVPHIAVPMFLAAATAAPGGVMPVQSVPTWPNVNVIRAHLFGGDKADIELVSAELGKCKQYRVCIVESGYLTSRVVQHLMHVDGASNKTWAYIGTIRPEDDAFVMTDDSPLPMSNPKVAFFVAYFNMMDNRSTPGIKASCRASRRAEQTARTVARIAAEKLTARAASVAAFAAAAKGEPLPTPAAIKSVHYALQLVKDLDEDKAVRKNDVGFSKSDVLDGHFIAGQRTLTMEQALAGRRLVRRYRGQIPAAMVRAALEIVAA